MTIITFLVSRAEDEMCEFPLPTPGVMETLEWQILPVFRPRDIRERSRSVGTNSTLLGKDIENHFLFRNPDMQNPYPESQLLNSFSTYSGNLTHHSLLINWSILVCPFSKLHPSLLVGNIMDTANPWQT
jgi:hypothetical protein